MRCTDMVLFVFPLLEVCQVSWICKIFFFKYIKSGQFQQLYFSNHFLPILHFFSSGTHITHVLDHLIFSHRFLKLWLFLFSVFSLYSSDWKLSTNLFQVQGIFSRLYSVVKHIQWVFYFTLLYFSVLEYSLGFFIVSISLLRFFICPLTKITFYLVICNIDNFFSS